MTTANLKVSEQVVTRQLLPGALAGGVLSALGNLILYLVALNLLSVSLQVPQPGGTTLAVVPLPAVLIFSFLPALVAAALLYGLARFTARPWTIFFAISGAFLLLSLIPSMTVAGATLGTKLVLSLMHVIAAAAIVGALARFARA